MLKVKPKLSFGKNLKSLRKKGQPASHTPHHLGFSFQKHAEPQRTSLRSGFCGLFARKKKNQNICGVFPEFV
jgi:hypothetical protein